MGLKLGVMPVLSGGGAADPAMVAAFVRTLEEVGCESVWAVEHVVIPDAYTSRYPYDPSGRMSLAPDDDVPDPLHWLTFAAAHTERLLLGTAMLILPEHSPVVLAKRMATLDALSGGRLLVGVGVGWLREEYEAVGVPFRDRGARADEYVAAMRTLWTQWPASFHGRFVDFSSVHCRPAPRAIPIVVGGAGPAAARRAARLGDGFYPIGLGPAELASLLRTLQDECAAIGRDPGEIEVTARAPSTRDEVEQLVRLGVARVVMRVRPGDPDAVRASVARYVQTVLEGVRP